MLKRLAPVTARLCIASLFVLSALPALAQEEEAVPRAPESGAWVGLLIAILCGFGIAIGCMMSPKRTHQD